ncbi:adenosylcobinamide-phosphate synthase CbiB [Ruminococcus sp. HUN007]|uniref:adenosylcobinamide-phosphate synthase CbiB n=1 Tax=Ruminococcus sp. HUN007 TaxID=1514668 RepID=UPI0005D242C8|nr:adenosylcobinamide-phosphate synthase CbiB [Ruminococcus sp. HUN007]
MKFVFASLPLITGFLLDCLIGDPYTLPHPVRLIGKLIAGMEGFVRKKFNDLFTGGVFLTVTVVLITAVVSAAVLFLAYSIHPAAGIITESIMIFYLLAARNLRDESMKVFRAAESGDTEGARKAVSMIVGRDTSKLDRDGIVRAAVETVAENTSDGVTAPMFWTALFGAAGGFVYKAVNTMDSMIGYKNEKYKDLGRCAAKLDDVLNYIPSRFTALLMVLSCPFIRLDGKNAYRIWKRDRRKHASPNSAQTESACAGALHLRLAGDAWYFGELHKKEYIGDDDRAIEPADIRGANRLMYVSSVFMLVFSVLFRYLILSGWFL